MDIFGYLKANQKTFEEDPIRHLDVLAYTWITYFDMPAAISKLPLSIEGWKEEPSYAHLHKYHRSFVPKSSERIVKLMAESPRFKDSVIVDYQYETDSKRNLQFGVIAYRVGGKIIIAFEGTDLSYVGWREDFVMAYSDFIASYVVALSFIEKIMNETEEPIILSGHSKGGSIATYCLANMNDDSRIEAVYSFEGPGFHSKGVFDKHPERAAKVMKYVPHNAIVGILLNNESDFKIVRTYTVGILQHNPLRWVIKDNDFVYLKKRTLSSRFIDVSVNRWINSLSEEEKERFARIFFTNLEAFGPDEFKDLYQNFLLYIPALSRAHENLEKDDKMFFDKVIKRLAFTMASSIKEKGQRTFQKKKPKQIKE